MKIDSIQLVCFSPTGTGRKIAETIADSLEHNRTELTDITKPVARRQVLRTKENDLLIVVLPVYMGRIPAVLSDWLHSIQAENTPAVCVVIYGNRAYDSALLELKDVLTNQGCRPFAAAAFIGEHSFSSEEFPSSVGRPDQDDLYRAGLFASKILEKLGSITSPGEITGLKVPGTFPYGGTTELWKVDFKEVSESCTRCGLCAENCPNGAIDVKNSRLTDIQKCILCCACIKNCPAGAVSMKPGLIKEAAIRCTKFIERREPEYFL